MGGLRRAATPNGVTRFQHPVVEQLELEFNFLDQPGQPALTLKAYTATAGSTLPTESSSSPHTRLPPRSSMSTESRASPRRLNSSRASDRPLLAAAPAARNIVPLADRRVPGQLIERTSADTRGLKREPGEGPAIGR